MPSFRPILDHLRRTALRGLPVPMLFARYRETRDEAAMVELVTRTTPRLRARCRPYLQDRDEIDEAVQEVFRLLVERAATIRDENVVESWLDKTAMNVARNRSRRQARRTPQPLPPEELVATDPTPGPELIAELREKYAHVLAEIDRLNEDWKRAFTLRLLEERPYAEVAEILGASLDKVKQDVCRARKQLRARLARKGIVLPAALVGVLLGGTARGHAPVIAVAFLAGLILVGVVYVAVGPPVNPEPPPPAPPVPLGPKPVVAADLSTADDRVLGRVVSLLDQATGMKTTRTHVHEEGPRRVRWRFAWSRDPRRDPNQPLPLAGLFVTEKSWVDLVFDRWTGAVAMELAADGKQARNIDPHRPINFGRPGAELVIGIPELVEVFQAFPPMLLRSAPAEKRPGPPSSEPLPVVIGPNGKVHIGRAEPDQGVTLRLGPGETLVATRRPGPGGERVSILVWRPGYSQPIQSLQHGVGPWTYCNGTNEPEELFFAAISDKTNQFLTCQPRLTVRADGAGVLDFDEDYEGLFENARLEVVVR